MSRRCFCRPVLAAGVLVTLALLASGCSSAVQGHPLPSGVLQVGTSSGTVELNIEVAANPRARSVGLMGRLHLPRDAGMVFLFDGPVTGPFWMKNTLIPLSIAFWDHSGRILKILDMAPCPSEPCRLYHPGVTYVGAVEANRGWFSAHGVRPGHRVVLSGG